MPIGQLPNNSSTLPSAQKLPPPNYAKVSPLFVGEKKALFKKHKSALQLSADEEAALFDGSPDDAKLPPISLFDDTETLEDEDPVSDTEYTGNSIHFYGLAYSMAKGQFFCGPLFFSFFTLALQIIALNGLLFQYHIETVPFTNTWKDLLNKQIGLQEKAGVCAALTVVPLILIAKLGSNGEFQDTAVFLSTIVWYRRLRWVKGSVRRMCILFFWLVMHAARTFYLIPLFTFINALVLSNETDLRMVFLKVMAIAFLLEIDDNVFTALYRTSPIAANLCTRQIGVETEKTCTKIKEATITVLCIFQIVITIWLKIQDSMTTLWFIPAMALSILIVYLYYFPTSKTVKIGLSFGFITVFAVFAYSMWCYLFPVCLDTVPYDLFFPTTTKPSGKSPIIIAREKDKSSFLLYDYWAGLIEAAEEEAISLEQSVTG